MRKWSRECCFAKKRAARCSHSRVKVVELVGYCGFSFEIELVKYLTETACNLEKIIFGCVDRRRSRFGVDKQYKSSPTILADELSSAMVLSGKGRRR
ncbi:hypothetical protein ACLB2K_001299 [Fragaria x ananassa]